MTSGRKIRLPWFQIRRSHFSTHRQFDNIMAGTRLLIQVVLIVELVFITGLALYLNWNEVFPKNSFTCNQESPQQSGVHVFDRKKALLSIWIDSNSNSNNEEDPVSKSDIDYLAKVFHNTLKHYWGDSISVRTNFQVAPEIYYMRDLRHTILEHVENILQYYQDIQSDNDMQFIVVLTADDSMLFNARAVHWKNLGFITHATKSSSKSRAVEEIEKTLSFLLNQINETKNYLDMKAYLSKNNECKETIFQKYLQDEHYFAILSPLVAPLILPMILGLKEEIARYRKKRSLYIS